MGHGHAWFGREPSYFLIRVREAAQRVTKMSWELNGGSCVGNVCSYSLHLHAFATSAPTCHVAAQLRPVLYVPVRGAAAPPPGGVLTYDFETAASRVVTCGCHYSLS